jgi:hypothetical protein
MLFLFYALEFDVTFEAFGRERGHHGEQSRHRPVAAPIAQSHRRNDDPWGNLALQMIGACWISLQKHLCQQLYIERFVKKSTDAVLLVSL